MCQGSSEDAHPTQTRLLRQVCDGRNRDAWSDFHRIYAPMIRGFLGRMGLIEADCDDATQETLIAAHQALRDGTYDPTKGGFRGWLYGVARNKALMAHRNRRRPSRVQALEFDDTRGAMDLLSNLEDTREQAERHVWEQEWRYAVLAEAIRQVRPILGDKVFRVFVAYGVGRQPAEEVAAELGLSVSSVYVYKQRALQAVREWIDRFEHQPGQDP